MTRLDIFSDPVCPWCYIGKVLLDRALEAHPAHDFVIEWQPFQLNPDLPREGVDRASYLEAKFGGKARAAQVYARIEEAAQAAGLVIDFAAMKRMPNTLDAHRLIHWAGLEGRQAAMVAALFAAFFRDGRDIDRSGHPGRVGRSGRDGPRRGGPPAGLGRRPRRDCGARYSCQGARRGRGADLSDCQPVCAVRRAAG